MKVTVPSKIKRSLRNKKFNVLLFFFGIAFLFSVLTKLSDSYTKTLSFNIHPMNLPEDKVVVLDSTHVLDVTVNSKGFDLVKYYFGTPSLEVDFSKLETSKSKYLWTEKQQLSQVINALDKDFKVQNITPDSLWFTYDSQSVKIVPVHLKERVDFKPGFDIVDDFKISPDSIKLIGPKQMLEAITNVSTKTLKLESVNSNIEKLLNIDLTDLPKEVQMPIQKVAITGKVDKFTEGSVIIPISLKNTPKDVKVKFYPKVIEVLFYTSLGQYDSIKKADFVVECSFNSNSKESYLIPKIVKKPNGLKNVRLSTKQIEYIVTQ